MEIDIEITEVMGLYKCRLRAPRNHVSMRHGINPWEALCLAVEGFTILNGLWDGNL